MEFFEGNKQAYLFRLLPIEHFFLIASVNEVIYFYFLVNLVFLCHLMQQ